MKSHWRVYSKRRRGFTLVELPAASRRKRLAFTLVELLVVITIIGMLVALLLPAVNSARESARQTTCMNNQRNFGEAIQQYVTTKDYFPGYRSLVPYGTNSAVISWQTTLMPNMGKTDVYQGIRDATLTQLPYWESSVCPSDNTISGRSNPWTSYVVNTGQLDNPSPTITPFNPPDVAADGIFHDFAKTQALVVKVSLSDLKSGQATTLMITENLDARYYSDSPVTMLTGTPQALLVPGTPNNNSSLGNQDTSERGTGFVWWDTSTTSAGPMPPAGPPLNHAEAAININRGDYDPATVGWPTSGDTSDKRTYAARPSSSHPGGVMATFAGGNCRFVKEDIDYALFCRLMVTNANNVVTKFKPNNPPGSKSWMRSYQIDEGQF